MNGNLTKAMALFDTPEKWAAFCVLCDKRDEMLRTWLSELADKLQKKLDAEKWIVKFEHPSNTAIKFHLKEYGERALSLVWYMDNPRITLWVDPKSHNADFAKSLLGEKLQLDDSYIKGNDWDLYSKEIKGLRGDRYSALYALSHNDAKWEEIFKTYIHKFVTERTAVFEDICKSTKNR